MYISCSPKWKEEREKNHCVPHHGCKRLSWAANLLKVVFSVSNFHSLAALLSVVGCSQWGALLANAGAAMGMRIWTKVKMIWWEQKFGEFLWLSDGFAVPPPPPSTPIHRTMLKQSHNNVQQLYFKSISTLMLLLFSKWNRVTKGHCWCM